MHRGGSVAPWLLLIAIASCSPDEPSRSPEPEERQQYAAPAEDVRGEYERFVLGWLNAYNGRDVDALLTLYLPDAIRMPPGTPAQRGTEAIREGLRETFERLEELVYEGASQEVHFVDGWAVERGSYTLTARVSKEGPPLVERGKYVVVARRGEDGAWRVLWEIWNPNTPEPEPVGVSGPVSELRRAPPPLARGGRSARPRRQGDSASASPTCRTGSGSAGPGDRWAGICSTRSSTGCWSAASSAGCGRPDPGKEPSDES